MAESQYAKPWGTYRKDFTRGGSNRTYNNDKSSSAEQPKAPPAARGYSRRVDNFYGFLRRTYWYEDAENDGQISDADCLDDMDGQIFPDDVDSDDPDAEINLNLENIGGLDGMNLNFTETLVNKYRKIFDEVGDTPSINSYPTVIQRQILTHDQNYEATVHNLFNKAARLTEETVLDSEFTRPFWRWLQANQDDVSRGRILEVLLHPLVRSHRVRAAIGKRDWSNLAADLDMKPLEKEFLLQIQNALGTYAVMGVRKKKPKYLTMDVLYGGRGLGMKFIKLYDVEVCGARGRLFQHLRYTEAEKRKNARRNMATNASESEQNDKPSLYAYNLLAHDDMEVILFALLSTFPPVIDTHSDILNFFCLLNLAETVDITLLETMSPHASSRWGSDLARQIRPINMPHSPFEGLNRALPAAQNVKITMRINWEPHEVLIFKKIFTENKARIYMNGIQWKVVEEKLQQEGIEKPRRFLKSLYMDLAGSGQEEIESYRSWTIKNRWQFVWRLKQFLEEKRLIRPGPVSTDLYLHIPELENGSLTSHQLGLFLHRHSFPFNEAAVPGTINRAWMSRFGSQVLPHMLLKEVWERVEETPSDFFRLVAKKRPIYLMQRVREIVSYFIHKGAGERRPVVDLTDTPENDYLIMDWPFFLSVYLGATTQLLVDGVPRHRVILTGVIDIVDIWRHPLTQQLGPVRQLSKWRYDAAKDEGSNADLKVFRRKTKRTEGIQEEQPSLIEADDDTEPQIEYQWPEQPRSFELFSSAHSPGALTSDPKSKDDNKLVVQCDRVGQNMGQHTVSTIRILSALAKVTHHEGFKDPEYTYPQFWEHFWDELQPQGQWCISHLELKSRFHWILEWILAGELPLEASAFVDALYQIWYGVNGVLKIATHPYSMTVDCPYSHDLINPDLDPRWVKGILCRHDTGEKLQGRLRRLHQVNITEKDIYAKYGVLLPFIWEKAYAEGRLDGKRALFRSHPERSVPTNVADAADSAPESVPARLLSEDEQLIQAVCKIIIDDYLTGNGITWQWLHLQRTHSLGERSNGTLLARIMALEPDWEAKEKRFLLKIRQMLGITDALPEDQFSWDGKLIPSGFFNSGEFLYLYRPSNSHCTFGIDAEKFRNCSGVYIFFDNEGIKFRDKEGRVLLSHRRSEMRDTRLAFYTDERELQKMRTEQAPNLKESASTTPPKKKPSITMEEVEWIFSRIPPGEANIPANLLQDFEEHFGYVRYPKWYRDLLRTSHGGPNMAPTDWTVVQRRWVVDQANAGTAWSKMAIDFKNKFRLEREAVELEKEFDYIQTLAKQPADARPKWLEKIRKIEGIDHEPLRVFQDAYSEREIDWIVRELKRLSPREDNEDKVRLNHEELSVQINSSLNARFQKERTSKGTGLKIVDLCKSHPDLTKSMSGKEEHFIPYTEEEIAFLKVILKGKGGRKKRDQVAAFREKFGDARNDSSIRGKLNKLEKKEKKAQSRLGEKTDDEESPSPTKSTKKGKTDEEKSFSSPTKGGKKRKADEEQSPIPTKRGKKAKVDEEQTPNPTKRGRKKKVDDAATSKAKAKKNSKHNDEDDDYTE